MVGPWTTAAAFFAGEQPSLRGDGLVLRPWRPDDAPIAVRAFTDPAIARWHLRTLTPGQGAGWVAERRQRWAARSGVDWAVVDGVDDGPLLARVGLHFVVPEQGRATVAYWVLPEARGARVTARALEILVSWLFTDRGMHRLELEHSVHNAASCRVATRAGFALEGTKRAELRHADGWHDMHLHARLADDPPPSRTVSID